MNDVISRKAAIDRFNLIRPVEPRKSEYTYGIDVGIAMCIVSIKDQSSAQPDMSEYSDKLWKAAYERGKAEAQPDLDEVYAHAETEAEARFHAEIVRCKDCKHWRQQTNYQGVLLSFGFCESDAMWCSLYGETTEVAHIDTDDDFYCEYAERRTDDR